MLREAKTWSILLSKVGNAKQLGRQIDQFFRHYVLEMLIDEGFFEYAREPHTYDQIINKFGFIDSDYTRSALDTLVKDKSPLITLNGDQYQSHPGGELSPLAEIADQTNKSVQSFSLMAKGMTQHILPRLRGEEIEFADAFEPDGRQLLTKFDTTLGSNVYTTLRDASFSFLTRQDREQLIGNQLLEIGCGSGRETADIWLRLKGDIHITAIDPVESLLNLARERFPTYLDEMQPGHMPLTMANRPTFYQLDAIKLPFEDNTFDAVFHAFVLHWISDPAQAIREIVRVLKPGGFVFGVQPVKPTADGYFDLVVRTSDSYGFFWKDDMREWYATQGVKLEIVSPMAIFRGSKPNGHVSR